MNEDTENQSSSEADIYPTAFLKWFGRNEKRLQAKNPAATSEELKKLASADWWHRRTNP